MAQPQRLAQIFQVAFRQVALRKSLVRLLHRPEGRVLAPEATCDAVFLAPCQDRVPILENTEANPGTLLFQVAMMLPPVNTLEMVAPRYFNAFVADGRIIEYEQRDVAVRVFFQECQH